MAITVAQGFVTLGNVRKDISDLTSAEVEMANFVDNLFFESIAKIDPEKLLVNRLIKKIAGTVSYALPTNFRDNKNTGVIYRCKSGTLYYALNYDAQTTNFTVGKVLTGTTSGAYGTIVTDTDYGTTGTLKLSNCNGDFIDNEPITDNGVIPGAATANGTQFQFEENNKNPVIYTGFGSSLSGYYLDSSNIVFTGLNDNTDTYTFRYMPVHTDITSTSDSFCIPDGLRKSLLCVVTVAVGIYSDATVVP